VHEARQSSETCTLPTKYEKHQQVFDEEEVKCHVSTPIHQFFSDFMIYWLYISYLLSLSLISI